MNRFRLLALMGMVLALALTGAAQAETKVELKGVHLCCPMCVSAVGGILKKIDGVEGKCDQAAKTVTITAPDNATAQKAVDALAAGGFQGTSNNKDITVKDDSGAEKGKAKSVTVTGVHNCCRQCTQAIQATLKKVEGVTGDTVKARENTFEVTGDFDVQALVKALNDAGFHVKVKK
jgi:copper chaperone CopZ